MTRPKVDGRIRPDELYTKEGIRTYAGIGDEPIDAARQAGKLTPHYFGGRVFYRGDELIRLIISSPNVPNNGKVPSRPHTTVNRFVEDSQDAHR